MPKKPVPKRVKPMDTSIPNVSRYVDPIMPERTNHKINGRQIFEGYKPSKSQKKPKKKYE